MTKAARTVLTRFPVRKSKKQKAAFRQWLLEQLSEAGWEAHEEGGGRLIPSANVVAGDPETAAVIYTAHYDTCAALPFPNFLAPMNLLASLCYTVVLCAGFFLLALILEIGMMVLTGSYWVSALVVYAAMFLCIWAMFFGKANKHNTNDNSSGVMLLLEIAAALPPEQRENVCLVFFDNEEKGLLGSGRFHKAHKKTADRALLVNFDCVSDGDTLCLFPGKAVKKEAGTLKALERAFLPAGNKQVLVPRGFAMYPSDQAHFRRGVGVAALRSSRLVGLHLSRIHTRRDTVLEEQNLELLLAGALRLPERLAWAAPQEAEGPGKRRSAK